MRRALEHLGLLRAAHRHVELFVGDALAVEKVLCPDAVGAAPFGIDFDLRGVRHWHLIQGS